MRPSRPALERLSSESLAGQGGTARRRRAGPVDACPAIRRGSKCEDARPTSPPTTIAPTANMSVAPAAASPGDIVTVTATGLAPRSIYSVQICGQDAQTSADCILSSSRTGGASDVGLFTTTLQVEIPPAPCPCVVAAFSQPYVSLQLRAPSRSRGHRSCPLAPARRPVHRVRSAELTGSFTAAELFGASAHRTLQLTLTTTAERPDAYRCRQSGR